jgi:site-specific recombinase XerD
VGCLFIDLQKAFDCVRHSVLIEKLKAAGFTVEAVTLFKSYLSNRGKSVQINGKSSRTILAGIAQHSRSYIISYFHK